MFIANMLYVFSKKDDYKYLILLLLFVMIFKTILKDIFKIPPHIGSPSLNYVFPSGHIYFATVFYTWITFYKNSLKFGLFSLIALIFTSFAIVYKNYHGIPEIVCTFLLAIFTGFVYIRFSKFIVERTIIITFSLISLVLYLLSIYVLGSLKIDTIIGTYGILGFILGFSLKRNTTGIFISVFALIICYLFTINTQNFVIGLRWYFILFICSFLKFIKEKVIKYLSHF